MPYQKVSFSGLTGHLLNHRVTQPFVKYNCAFIIFFNRGCHLNYLGLQSGEPGGYYRLQELPITSH